MNSTRKLTLAAILTATAVVGSVVSFPILGSRCAPVQHMVNVFCAVLLGTRYGVGSAFVASFLRNIFGLGTLLAFPGSMCGAFLSGLSLLANEKYLADGCCGSFRHGNCRRVVCVSDCDFVYGQSRGRHRVLCLCCAVFNFDGLRLDSCETCRQSFKKIFDLR